MRSASRVSRCLAGVLIGMVRLYQWTIGPLFTGQCRFHPTCSHYFIQVVEKHGPVRGAWKGCLRLLRCQPFHPGGDDPP